LLLQAICFLLPGRWSASAAEDKPYSIAIRGNNSIPEKVLLKAAEAELQTFALRGYRKADIDDAAFQMRTAYLQAGFAFVIVDYIYDEKENFKEVIFNIDEGPKVFVRKIIFKNNRRIPSEILLDIFLNSMKTTGGRQEIIYVEAAVRDGLNRVRDHYRREGYIAAAVAPPVLFFNEDNSGVTISVTVKEGPRYLIRNVTLNGDLIPELAPELEKIRNDLIGKAYYVRQKLLLRTRLEDAYDAIGYADADIDLEVVRDNETGDTVMVVEIQSGEKLRIADIVVSGNRTTKESFIRGRLQLAPGDIYTRKKRTESFRKLYDSGLFKKIDMELTETGDAGSRVLEVKVQELPGREYYIEPGWGSYEALRLRAGAFEKNLFGTGKNARIDGLVSIKGETITLSYTDPWLLQTDIAMNIPLYYERREEPSYTSEETGLGFLLLKRLSRNLTLSGSYRYKMTQLFDINDGTPLLVNKDDYNQGLLGIQAVWDNRNDFFFPTEGMRLSGGFDIALPALGSDIRFGRFTLGGRYFIKLPQEYVLGLRVTTGLIIPINDQAYIPISERFFNGGDNTVRSYEHAELGPKDSTNEPVGGLGYNVFSIELRKRFYRNFAVTVYADAGNVSPNISFLEKGLQPYTGRSELFNDTLSDFFREFKFGIGIGLQYLLPVGPIRFDLAYNPDPEEAWNEDSWVYHFSLGMSF
jgi:outer membrane protein assembly complex protein YaeT